MHRKEKRTLPKPNKGEAKQDYLKRCTDQLVSQEGKPADQAFAMCNSFWDQAKNTRSALSLTATVSLAAGDDNKPKTFLITAYTGQIVDLGWFGKFVFDLQGIKAAAKMPVLREHQRDRVVGFSKKAWVQEGNFLISGTFSQKTPDAQEVLDLGEEGFPWQASVGIWPLKIKVLESDKESAKVNGQEIVGPVEIWLESVVREVSFVSLGADDHTAAIVLSRDADVPVEIEGAAKLHKEDIMPINLVQLEQEAPELLNQIREQARSEGVAAGLVDGAQAERDRVMKILRADGDRALTLEAVEQGSTVETALEKLLQAEKVSRVRELENMKAAAPASMGQGSGSTVNPDYEAKVQEFMGAGKNRIEAIRLAANQYPELHQAYLDRHNPVKTKED
jgi:hypothetical protein